MTASQDKVDQAMLAQLQELLADRFSELVERFITDGGKRVDLLREAIPLKDFDVIHAEAHGLKGSSRNIGANILGEVCGQLEQQGRHQSDENLETLFAAVEQEFAAVCDVLSSYE